MENYTHARSHILPKSFWLHFGRHLRVAVPLLALSLGAGVCGYHFIEGLNWIDALFNASMIMGGMGPANELHTAAGKMFASIYALYSGLFLIAVTGYLLIPFIHRVLKKLESQKN
ncbi:MAG: hypothetical protein IPO54_04960 [Micavibrio sp.]|nr:hypothetical protein [Micavibrio sp.]